MSKKIVDKIVIPEERSKELETLHYEVNCHSQLLAYLINQDTISTNAFTKYSHDYREFFMQYEVAKRKLYKDYIENKWDGQNVKWELEFSENTIYIIEN